MRAITARGEHMINGQINVVDTYGLAIHRTTIYVTEISHDSTPDDRASILFGDGKNKNGGIGGSGILF
ncbi:MAG: hypothetical protein H6937_13010 [Burkholderiales bacterium]|nr:hypothetical protein [Burkholderiales bacterium]MCP5246809.1 hypothetical protein [Burkholderiales bacterium]